MNVLVTALGTMASHSVIKQLKKRGNVYIVGTDIYPEVFIASSKEIDKFVQVEPVLNQEKYLEQVTELCIQYKIDYVFPIIDEEVQLLAENRHNFQEFGTTVCVSNLESIKLSRDKLQTYYKINEMLPEIAIETMILADFNDCWEYPVFAKPREGRASIGCIKIDTKEDLEHLKRTTKRDEILVQKYYTGNIFAVDVLRDQKNNDIRIIIREELLRNKNGSGTVVKIVNDEYINNICYEIAQIFDFNGVFNIELIKNENQYKLIEINPRFPAGTEFSCMAGLDLVNGQLNIMMGKGISSGEIKYGNIYARRYEAYDMQSK